MLIVPTARITQNARVMIRKKQTCQELAWMVLFRAVLRGDR